jgi:predicted SAM-dependent methyltransferase
MKRLAHLGCGKRHLEGYIHVDLADYPHIDHCHDIRTLPMFEDDSLDGIYASHVLEYFDRIEVEEVLAEWRRALRPGGFLRLAVPDFEALCGLYMKTGDLGLVIGPLYGRWCPTPGLVIHHKTVYDFESLARILLKNGFSPPRRWDWREVFSGIHVGYDDYSQAYYPHMDKEKGRLMSLNVETEKLGCRS